MLEKVPGIVPDILWFSCDGMMVIDEQRRILAMNPALEQMTGRASEEVAGKLECGTLFSCRDEKGCSLREHPEECPGLKAMRQFRSVPSAEYTIRIAEGKGRVMSASYTPIQLPDRPVWTLVVMRDISAAKRRERQLLKQAKSDPLTGLANRAAFLEACFKEIKRASRHGGKLAVAMVDLDGFKGYNDQHGHLAGDDLLKGIAQGLQTGRRASDLVTRYGGDEFALLLPETDAAGAVNLTERLCHLLGRAHPPMTLSIGVAVYPEDGTSTESLLSRADRRLYQAKGLGGNRVISPSF